MVISISTLHDHHTFFKPDWPLTTLVSRPRPNIPILVSYRPLGGYENIHPTALYYVALLEYAISKKKDFSEPGVVMKNVKPKVKGIFFFKFFLKQLFIIFWELKCSDMWFWGVHQWMLSQALSSPQKCFVPDGRDKINVSLPPPLKNEK